MDVDFLMQCRREGMFPSFVHKMRLHTLLTMADKKRIWTKVLNKTIEREKLARKRLFNDLFLARNNLYNNVSRILFSLAIRHVVSNFKPVKEAKKLVLKHKLDNLRVKFVTSLNFSHAVVNLSNYTLKPEETKVLQLGFTHGVKSRLNEMEVKSSVEAFYKKAIEIDAIPNTLEIRSSVKRAVEIFIKHNKDLNCAEHQVLHRLRQNDDIVVSRFDKGNGVVILNKEDYLRKMQEIIDGHQFCKVRQRINAVNPAQKDEDVLKKLLNELLLDGHISERLHSSVQPHSLSPARIYGLPKIHKNGCPLRPILSMVGTPQYMVAKMLHTILKPLIKTENTCADSFELVKMVKQLTIEDSTVLCSFDIESLFPSIPVEETIGYCLEEFDKLQNDQIDKVGLKKLLEYCCRDVPFLYNGSWYKQVDGVAMGSPLAPTLAGIFLNKLERQFTDFEGTMPKLFIRYVDDCFVAFKQHSDVQPFLKFCNALHPNIKYTIEYEKDKSLPFLDLLITKNGPSVTTSLYFKPTDTGLYTTDLSFCDGRYKNSLIHNLLHRAWSLGNTFKSACENIDVITKRLINNGYHQQKIEYFTNKVVNNIHLNKNKATREKADAVLVLPYGLKAAKLRSSLLKMMNKVKSVDIIFRTNKLSSYFSNKCQIPKDMQSNVVYKFCCAGCGASYIGETMRSLRTRVGEHTQRSRASHIYEHTSTCDKRSSIKANLAEFNVIKKNFLSTSQRKAFEALCIMQHKPKLNIQLDFADLLLVF